jgi:hypothetical protein
MAAGRSAAIRCSPTCLRGPAARPGDRHADPAHRAGGPGGLGALGAARLVAGRGHGDADRRCLPANRRARRRAHLCPVRRAAVALGGTGARPRHRLRGRRRPGGAEAAWLPLRGMLAVLCAVSANRVPHGISGALLTMRDGEPGWVAALDGRRPEPSPATARQCRPAWPACWR